MENKTKLRLLYLYQHLLQYTDAEHKLTTPQLIEILDKQDGIDVNLNTLANDFKMLEQAGHRADQLIVDAHGHRHGAAGHTGNDVCDTDHDTAQDIQ